MRNTHGIVLASELDPRVFGQRLAQARKSRGLTQESVAESLDFSRPTYIAIEKGQRQAKPQEIIKLARLLGRSVHDLVRPGEPVVGLAPNLRAVAERMSATDSRELLEGIAEFERLAEDYRDIERLLNAPLGTNYPPEVSWSRQSDVAGLADSVAVQERQRLGLGDQPVGNLRGILEFDVGLRIFYWDLPPAIAGMYAHVAELGGCILINRKHPAVRRRVSMVHEYGHLIVDRFKAGIDQLRPVRRKPLGERFAEAFALAFLMPASSVRQRFHDIVSTTGDFRVGDLCRLSQFYFVSFEAMARRLERLGLIPGASLAALKREKLAVTEAATSPRLEPHPDADDPCPQRYKSLAVQAYELGKISQGRLARYLRCDPVQARRIVTECLTSSDVAEDGEWRTWNLEEPQQSLLASAP